MEYKGDLKGFPKEVVEWMLDEQERQGNKRDISVFENDKQASKDEGGFNWTESNYIDAKYCYGIIILEDFDLFLNKFPNKQEFPCDMWCWDDRPLLASKLFVIGKVNNLFVCVDLDYKEDFKFSLRHMDCFEEHIYFYKNASLENPVKEYSIEEAEKEFNIKIKR